MSGIKRLGENDNSPVEKKQRKEVCPHQEKCYRRNPHHFKEYEHPHLLKFMESTIPDNFPQPKNVYSEQIEVLRSMLKKDRPSNMQGSEQSTSSTSSSTSETSLKQVKNETKVESHKFIKPGTMLDKLEKAAPYNIFFTSIPKSPEASKHSNVITFTDLICPSLGTLKCSLQMNFMIDIMWLMEQYQARNLGGKPMTILCADEFPKMKEYMEKFLPNVTYHFVQMKDPFGIHHSKVGIYLYEDNSLRIVISTANLYYEDWNHYNQGLWLSPSCPQLPNGSSEKDGESPTGFKAQLLTYLKYYNVGCLKPWIEHIKKADFSSVRVCLVGSVPGKHYNKDGVLCHLHRVGDLLSKYCNLPAKTTPDSEGPLAWGVIAQASSIGSMGKGPGDWLRSTLLRSLSAHKQGSLTKNSNSTLSIVYPSVDNVMNGYFGPESGGCLPYSKATNEKQRWFQDYLHQWKADGLCRTRAMPHIKTYCRVSPCLTKLAYFLLTSANLSKSAWGGNLQKDGGIYVRSYELGVMFLPVFFNEEYFEIQNTTNRKNKQLFPFMYDLPLTSYRSSDYPWCN